jgi:hypothetical protein
VADNPKLRDVSSKIRRGISRLPWAVRYGEICALTHKAFRDAYAEAPPAPAYCTKWADKLAQLIELANGSSPSNLYHQARRQGYEGDPEQFGADLANRSLEWSEPGVFPLKITVPRSEYTSEWDLQADPSKRFNWPPLKIVGGP